MIMNLTSATCIQILHTEEAYLSNIANILCWMTTCGYNPSFNQTKYVGLLGIPE